MPVFCFADNGRTALVWKEECRVVLAVSAARGAILDDVDVRFGAVAGLAGLRLLRAAGAAFVCSLSSGGRVDVGLEAVAIFRGKVAVSAATWEDVMEDGLLAVLGLNGFTILLVRMSGSAVWEVKGAVVVEVRVALAVVAVDGGDTAFVVGNEAGTVLAMAVAWEGTTAAVDELDGTDLVAFASALAVCCWASIKKCFQCFSVAPICSSRYLTSKSRYSFRCVSASSFLCRLSSSTSSFRRCFSSSTSFLRRFRSSSTSSFRFRFSSSSNYIGQELAS